MDTRLVEIAHNLLDSIADGLEAEGIPVPEKRYVYAADPVFDISVAQDGTGTCNEELIVTCNGLPQGVSFSGEGTSIVPGQIIKCAVPMVAEYTVYLTRCLVTVDEEGNNPAQDALEAEGEQVMEDVMTLAKVIVSKGLAKELTGQMHTSLVGIGNVDSMNPQGAMGGTKVILWVSLLSK